MFRPLLILAAIVACAFAESVAAQESKLPAATVAAIQKYCVDCHGADLAEARVNLEKLASAPSVADGFKDWEKAIRMLRGRKMPPKDAPQPSDAERESLTTTVESTLSTYIAKHAGDPGPVIIRRLTSAEYAYTIQDLTGLSLKLEKTFVSDAVGGEGFTNVGSAQFMEDATLQRYLEAGKIVADHAVIGAGPIEFFSDPGTTGRELSAINRIQAIYREHGFRTASGEGGKPFGLDKFRRALVVAWRYRHRATLGSPDATLATLARDSGLSGRFCEHVASALNSPDCPFPLSIIADKWRSLPPPDAAAPEKSLAAVRATCDELDVQLRDWQKLLSGPTRDEEEAALLTAGKIDVKRTHVFTADIDWAEDAETAEFELAVTTANSEPAAGAVVIWKNPRLRYRTIDRRRGEELSLKSQLSPETVAQLQFGKHPADGVKLGENDFVLSGEAAIPLKLTLLKGAIAAQLSVTVELDVEHGASRVVRCSISDGEVESETAADNGTTSALLADPASPAVAKWRGDVAQFASLLPAVSHREPSPSDRDPIPPPFDNTYNMPERNHFHTAVKYHRDDRFLVEHMLDEPVRKQLDQAWADLLTSFEYHDANLRFIAKKFKIELDGKGIADLDDATIERSPAQQRDHIKRLRSEYAAMQASLRTAEPGHFGDMLRFAELAWRRPLNDAEKTRLRDFYAALRRDAQLDHAPAIRALLTRILAAPAFLYRAEPSATQNASLSDSELASRLSYFLWSSLPDDELLRAAAAGDLRKPEKLAEQARRMLRDPKARRLATEFFGQWLGFYRFDEYRGIDSGRFPEFNDKLRTALYDEATSFFEHIVREDRPPAEILSADYTFLNASLARHYSVTVEGLPPDRFVRVDGLSGENRGGLLGLGAIHAATSAPLRTSAVKRGDWMLRRVLGTPVPPPPADAGSIAAEEVLADGLTVRKRLEAHRQNATCVNCHARIDPLGFALEHYDPLGRWRTEYQDHQPIDDRGTLSDGTEIVGMGGLRKYLTREQTQFERTLATRLLGYALGRAEMASDRPLIDAMLAEAKKNGRFSDLVVHIVSSKQFNSRRIVSASNLNP